MIVSTSAPGKLFLLGEYAVLDGAPALLTAVDRRVTVTVRPSSDGVWRVSARGLGVEGLALEAGGTLPASLPDSTRAALRVFDAVRTQLHATLGLAVLDPVEVIIDSTAFQHGGHKLGLGSSAAVATALTAALAIAAGLDLDSELDRDAETLRTAATAAHSAAQGGTGSGGDIATSVYGGLLLHTPGSPPTRLHWPEALGGFAIATGTGSATVDLVAKVKQFARTDPTAYRAALDDLSALAGQAVSSLKNVNAFLDLADDYFGALQRLDSAAKAGIVTEQHLSLRIRAHNRGGVFKTSGAGGGDLGLVFCQASHLDRLNEEFRSAFRIPLAGNPAGWRREAA